MPATPTMKKSDPLRVRVANLRRTMRRRDKITPRHRFPSIDDLVAWMTAKQRAKGVWNCHFCGIPLVPSTIELDHGTPLGRGGTSEPKNLLVTCKRCNGIKQDWDVKEFNEVNELLDAGDYLVAYRIRSRLRGSKPHWRDSSQRPKPRVRLMRGRR